MEEWMIWLLLAGLILLVLAVVVLRMKVGVRAVFGEGCKVWLKVGPGMILLYPREPEKEEKAQRKRAKKKEKEESSETTGRA